MLKFQNTEKKLIGLIYFAIPILLTGSSVPSHVWPEVQTEKFPEGVNWSVDFGFHIQAVDRPKGSDSLFYQRFRDYDDFVKHSQRPSYLGFQISRGFQNGWSIVSRTDLFPNWLQTNENYRYPRRIKDINFHTNTLGYIQKVGDNFALKFGRDYLVWDYDRTSTLLSNNLPPIDQIRLDVWGEKWFYHAFVSDINRRNSFINVDDYQYLIGHRLRIKPVHKLLLYFSEIMVFRRPLSLSTVNPFIMVYHDLEHIRRTENTIITLGYEWNVFRNWDYFFQFDFDDFNSRHFEYYEGFDNAYAFQTGVKSLKWQIYYTETSPWFYHPQGNSDVKFVFTEGLDVKGQAFFDRFIGYPLGGGAKGVTVSAILFPTLRIEYRYLNRTPNLILTQSEDTVSASIETRNRGGFTYQKELFNRVPVFVIYSWEHYKNYHHSGKSAVLQEFLVGFSYKLSRKKS